MKFNSDPLNQTRNHAPLALHDSCGWLACVLFLTYHLNACEQTSLKGTHAHLSS
jgi:hypothetical protein